MAIALPIDARASLIVLAAQLQALQTMIGSIERRLVVQHRANEASKRLESVPGIGIIGASAIAATVTDPNAFALAGPGIRAVHETSNAGFSYPTNAIHEPAMQVALDC